MVGPQGPSGVLASPTGVIVDFAGSAAPTGWYLCDGSSKNTTTDAALFAVIGYTYGGSGATFNVPDCRGRVTAGPDPTNLRLGNGSTGGFANNAAVLAAVSGEKAHTLLTAEMPSHNHTFGGAAASALASGGTFFTTGGGGVTNIWYLGGTDAAGGGSGSNVVQPTIIMNKIIKA